MGAVIRNKVTRADLASWNGVTPTVTRQDATGGTVTGLMVGNEVDVLQVYGSGTDRTRASIASAISNISSSSNVTLVFAPGTWTIDDNLTIASNFTCHVPAGCVFSVDSGKTLTFSGLVNVEYPATWTSGSGTVVVSLEGSHFGVYHRSAAERSASVTPTNYYKEHGHLYRYGTNTTPGTTDMATPLANALLVSASHPTIIPQANHLCGSALTVPATGQVYGFGKASIITKGFSGDLFTLGLQSQLRDFYIAGNGATYTGRGVVVSSGALDEVSWIRLTRMSIINMASYCVEFTQATAGYGSMLDGCRMTTTDQVVVALKCPDTEASNGNRFMVGCWTFGTPLVDFAGCDNMTVVGCEGAYPTFGADSKKVTLTGCRIVNNGPGSRSNWTIQGTSHAIGDNSVGVTTLTLNTALFKTTFRGNSLASGMTIADTSRGVADGNEIDIPQTTYTPTWTGSSVNPSIGTGTINGAWQRDGVYLRANIKMIADGTTTFGTGYYLFSVPRTAARRSVGSAYLRDTGTAYYVGTAYIEQGESTVRVVANAGADFTGTAIPFTWATTDELVIDISFPIT